MRRYSRDSYTNVAAFRTMLTATEHDEANRIGGARNARARRRGAANSAGFSGGLPTDQRGARCELAAAKILGMPWNVPLSDDFREIKRVGDVGPYEIRSTALPGGRLVIRERDADERQFVLAVEQPVRLSGRRTVMVQLAGWMFAGNAKREEWLEAPNGHRPAWFVPQKSLRPMYDLPELVAEREQAKHAGRICKIHGCEAHALPLSEWCFTHDPFHDPFAPLGA